MRRSALVAVLVALAVPAAAGSVTWLPRLQMRLAHRTQVVVRGLGFEAGERVTVRLIGRTVSSAATTAGAAGTFQVRFARPAPLACGQLVSRATGSEGSFASGRLGPPECNPPGYSR